MLSLPFAVLALSAVGAIVAGYLTFTHFREGALVCNVGGCKTVQESPYATIGPIPIAVLGLGMFIVLGVLALARMTELPAIEPEMANVAAWVITFSALLYYAYLVYIELFVLEAVCQWCVVTTIAAIGIFSIESILLWRWYQSDLEAEIE